jgi:hypothetical protein
MYAQPFGIEYCQADGVETIQRHRDELLRTVTSAIADACIRASK